MVSTTLWDRKLRGDSKGDGGGTTIVGALVLNDPNGVFLLSLQDH